ncbi:hypothetical protein AA0312_2721 [Acetobacter tropicalis NRIC 0312]|uniref:Uncharacterized protein n=1 Tax=Acetobacter tropicalis TaxID=104102 RepID=A0A511FNJ3_9PROT|nr:hypothetical protein AD944_12880 [Acetobacter tropicalis]GAL96318.1 hypothetical protein ATR1_039d0035 [Acetobacter tropicalis]GBR72124.1 hypothetical protein AA0312_2721 [Acetobacter tropicalis NRIC 0312]GEL50469.1 hypothetical protein ATR01nite_15440 [Acetobacter tropicalis]
MVGVANISFIRFLVNYSFSSCHKICDDIGQLFKRGLEEGCGVEAALFVNAAWVGEGHETFLSVIGSNAAFSYAAKGQIFLSVMQQCVIDRDIS